MHDYNLLYQKKLKTTSIFAKKVIKPKCQYLILFLKAKFDCRACFEIKQTSLQLAYLTSLQKFIMINNVIQDTDTQPQNINGRIYLPVAAILRAVGADVQWDNKIKSVVINAPIIDPIFPSNMEQIFTDNFYILTPVNDVNKRIAVKYIYKHKAENLNKFLNQFHELALREYF